MMISLPQLTNSNSRSLTDVINERRSCREFSEVPVTMEELSHLLWSAQGTTGVNNQRSAPSAGAQYPMELYLAAGNIEKLPVATYRYDSQNLNLHLVNEGDIRHTLFEASIDQQPWVAKAAVVFIFAGNFLAMRDHFHKQPPIGMRGDRYKYIETGAAAQNMHLQSTNLGLGMVLVGGFDDKKVQQALNLPEGLDPAALVCIGARN